MVEAWCVEHSRQGHAEEGGEELVTLREAAEALGVSRSTIRRWADTGKIRAVRTPGGHRRLPLADVRKLSEAGGSTRSSGCGRPTSRWSRWPACSRATARGWPTRPRARSTRRARPAGSPRTGARSGLADALSVLADAAASGDYERALDAWDALMRRARLGGASLLEKQLFTEALAEAASRALSAEGHPRDAVVSTRRLFREPPPAPFEPALTAKLTVRQLKVSKQSSRLHAATDTGHEPSPKECRADEAEQQAIPPVPR